MTHDFGPFGGRIWLNAAHQGPLPKVAVEAAREAVEWKRRPFEMTTERVERVEVTERVELTERSAASPPTYTVIPSEGQQSDGLC